MVGRRNVSFGRVARMARGDHVTTTVRAVMNLRLNVVKPIVAIGQNVSTIEALTFLTLKDSRSITFVAIEIEGF